MANDNKDLCDVVKKSKILLLDIEGTTTSISFVKDKLFPYAEENVKQFLESQWEKDDVKEAVAALRKLALEDKENSIDGVITIPGEDASKEDQIEGLVNSVKWQMSSDRKTGALKLLQGLIWKQGYDNGEIKGHVYDDVLPALEQWRSVEGQKVYIYSSGSVQAQKLLFGQSTAGDLLRFIDGHFDTAVGNKQEAASYTAIAEKIGCKPDEILFLTDIVKEAEAARTAGLHAALASREGNAPLPEGASASFPTLHSFAQLTLTNKRKTEPQDELPAKIPKTDTDEVKSTSVEVIPEATTVEATESVQPEKMEVDEAVVSATEETKEKEETEQLPVKIETVVEEIPDNVPVDAPVIDVEPVVIEKIEEDSNKTDEKETEKMDTETTEKMDAETDEKMDTEATEKNNTETIEKPKTESIEKTESTSVPKEEDNIKIVEEKASVPEEPAPTVITEIEEISNDKSLSEVAEIIDDLEPVVEEPPAVEEMEDLQNVGEVLEKECDEILSKVQDVTNLDNIPLKPLLNAIPEETMETENLDSNDIVDRILDTELELEMKQCKDIDLNIAEEITQEVSTKVVEENSVSETVSTSEPTAVSEEKPTENNVNNEESTNVTEEASNTTEEKVEGNSPVTEPTVEENKVEEKIEEQQKTEVESKDALAEQTSVTETETPVQAKETDSVTEEVKSESTENEPQLNGKTTNGDSAPANGDEPANVNGDASKDEELSARLSVENGKEAMNGSNGDSTNVEEGQGDKKVEADVSDIKVKTVSEVAATEEPRTDPIEQPSEA